MKSEAAATFARSSVCLYSFFMQKAFDYLRSSPQLKHYQGKSSEAAF